MKIVIYYDGMRHESPETDEKPASEVKELLYEGIPDMEKFSMELNGGGFLVLGGEAIKRATILVLE